MTTVLERIPGQDAAMAFLVQAASRPHHAYLFAGPEGSGKKLAARAFTAALLCARGGCGECRDCRLALSDRHPNLVLETSAMPYPVKIREAVQRLGAERVIYGSDGPVCSPRIEVEKVRLACLDAESERLVLGENARRLLAAVS